MNFRRKPPPHLLHHASTDKRPYDLGMCIQWLRRANQPCDMPRDQLAGALLLASKLGHQRPEAPLITLLRHVSLGRKPINEGRQ
jgi:hypothetical protein